MSMLLMVKAMKAKVGNPLRKLVLIKLADNANDQGECWPSYQYIADQCEIGKSTVKKHIKELEASGYLTIENRKGPKGNSSNLYHVMTQGGSPDSTGGGSPDSTGISHSFEPVNEPLRKRNICPYKEISDIYNECIDQPFPQIKGINTAKRKAAAKKFYNYMDKDLDKIRNYFIYFNSNASSWCRGETDRGWTADFEFIIKDDTVERARENRL